MKRDLQNDIIIGIIAGVISGLILTLSQNLVGLYKLPYTWIVAISLFFSSSYGNCFRYL